MKHQKEKPQKSKRHLKIPTYPGGKTAFVQFIMDNLSYPEEALKNKVEGTVYLQYTVDNIGTVGDIEIIHGIGSGCDEEAIRLVKMLKYDPERNKGIRMKTRMKTRIRFELPAHLKPVPSVQLNYTTTSPAPSTDASSPSGPKESTGYGYSIQFGPS